MITVGGKSYNNGIRFEATKYSVFFESDSNLTKIFLEKNSIGKNKVLNFTNNIPLIRGLIQLTKNSKFILQIFILDLLLHVLLKNIKSETNNSTLAILILSVALIILIISLCFLIKMLKDIKSTWQYHGAEHKVINANYENVPLTLENCKKASRISGDCGTMWVCLFLVVFLSLILICHKIGFDVWISIVICASWCVSLELFLMDRNVPILRYIFKVGYWLQEHVFTSEPSDIQLNQALEAFKLLEKAENDQIPDEELQELLKNAKQSSFIQKLF